MISTVNGKIKATEIYDRMNFGIRQIISKLRLKNPRIEIKTYETECKGIDYTAKIESNGISVDFYLSTQSKSKDLNIFERAYVSLKIEDETRPDPYHDFKWFDGEFPVSKWVTEFFHERSIAMQNRLNYLLADNHIKFVGDWGISTPSGNLFEVMVTGAIKCDYRKINIIRILCFDDDLRAYSYIVLLERSAFVFPDFCGPDSGEGGRIYEYMENFIEKMLKRGKITVYDVDIDYNVLKKFLVKHMSIDTFNSSIPMNEYEKYIGLLKTTLKNKAYFPIPHHKNSLDDRKPLSVIVSSIQKMGYHMERTPKTHGNKHEEDLRNDILTGLSSNFGFNATGETFSRLGKTDIMVAISEREIAIAECKIWGGIKKYEGSIDQLFKYLTCRQSYGIIITFSKTEGFTKNIETAKQASKNHKTFVKVEKAIKGESYFITKHSFPNDNRNFIEIHHLLFNLHTG